MGPLEGVKILEIAGIGPGPFAAMMLSDMGADVVKIEAPEPDILRSTPPIVGGFGSMFASTFAAVTSCSVSVVLAIVTVIVFFLPSLRSVPEIFGDSLSPMRTVSRCARR